MRTAPTLLILLGLSFSISSGEAARLDKEFHASSPATITEVLEGQRRMALQVEHLVDEVAALRNAFTSAGLAVPDVPTSTSSPGNVTEPEPRVVAEPLPCSASQLHWLGGWGTPEDWFDCVRPVKVSGVSVVDAPQGLTVYHGGAEPFTLPGHDAWFAASRDAAIKYALIAYSDNFQPTKVYEYAVREKLRLALVTPANMQFFKESLGSETIGDVFDAAQDSLGSELSARFFKGLMQDMRWNEGRKAWFSDSGKPPFEAHTVDDAWVRSRTVASLFYTAFGDAVFGDEEVRRDSRNRVDWVIASALCRLFRSGQEPGLRGLKGWYGHDVMGSDGRKFTNEIMLCKEGLPALSLERTSGTE